MHKMSGGCHCGNIVADVELSVAPDKCHPRACDCDFCRKHGAAYLSDPKGSLVLRIKDARDSSAYRQGSGQAEFILCRTCGVLVAVVLRHAGGLLATVNAKALVGAATFADERTVSPKTLSPEEKVSRWQDAWFSNVELLDHPE